MKHIIPTHKRTLTHPRLDAVFSTSFPPLNLIDVMPQWDMKRLASLPLLALAAISLGATPQEILTKRYQQFNKNILKSDSKGMRAWIESNCASKFTYTSYHKAKFDRGGYQNGILGQLAQTTKVLQSTLQVREFKRTGTTIVATVATEFKGLVVFDSRRLTLTDQSVTYETWQQSGSDWKLVKVIQINADTQMHQEGG